MRARVEDTVRFNSKAQVAKLAEAQDGDSEDDDDGLGEESSEAEAAVDVGIDGKHGWKTVKTAHNPKAVKCKRTIQYKMAGELAMPLSLGLDGGSRDTTLSNRTAWLWIRIQPACADDCAGEILWLHAPACRLVSVELRLVDGLF